MNKYGEYKFFLHVTVNSYLQIMKAYLFDYYIILFNTGKFVKVHFIRLRINLFTIYLCRNVNNDINRITISPQHKNGIQHKQRV